MHHKLSLRSAVLINLNVMVGFGIFINTVQLAKLAGFLGFACYALVAVLILPLILSFAALFKLHPEGGFYGYAAHNLHPFAGFMSSWTYFTGKLASAALIIHVVMTLLQNLIPALQIVPILLLDSVIILLFTLLNTYHMRIGSSLAGWFIMLKLTPILFAIFAGLYLLTGSAAPHDFLWAGIPLSIPYVLYAFTGFEAAISLSKSIESPEKNGPKAIIISFILAVCINVVYQFLFYIATQGVIAGQENYLTAFPTLLQFLVPSSPELAQKIVTFLHLALAVSALGGSYGILFSNHWNLHTLAEHGHVFRSSLFTRLNKYHIPTAGVIAEAVLCISYLLLTRGKQQSLQQLSALGSTIAYTMSIAGLLAAMHKGVTVQINRAIPWIALASCTLFIGSCVRNFMMFGTGSFIFFMIIVTLGALMYYYTSTHLKRHQRHKT
jgi:amino acid transporter